MDISAALRIRHEAEHNPGSGRFCGPGSLLGFAKLSVVGSIVLHQIPVPGMKQRIPIVVISAP